MSETTPTVSVTIIFLNGERYLEEAIGSVLAQTFHDWELLLVDDGSTDGSPAIARRYEAAHPGKVRYLEHPGHENRGMSAARNLGIRHSRGRFIAFLDADDVWYPPKLEEQLDIMEAYPEVAMVYGPMELWFSWSGRSEDARRDYHQPLGHPPDAVIEPPGLVVGFLRDDLHIPSGILVRREVVEAVGGFEDEFRASYEDVAFHSKVGLRFPVFASSRCWFRYRQHPESCDAVQKNTGTHRGHRRRYLEWMERYMQGHGLRGPAWRQLQLELFPHRHPRLAAARRAGEAAKRPVKFLLKRTLPSPWQRRMVNWWRSRRTEGS